MNLFNKKLLAQNIARFDFPEPSKIEEFKKILVGWQKALKDSNLNRTKETGIQGQFLIKFFEVILGYDIQTSGKEQWHLNQEPKTEIDAQEPDGALGFFTKDSSKTWAVIELKDAKTSLDKKQYGRDHQYTPIEQAFNYLNKFDRCKWAIVSNFREIRLYSKTRGMGFYEKFDILELDQDLEFKRFYFLLNKANLIDDGHESLIEQLVKDTHEEEENITKQFYAKYKEIRVKLFQHLVENNQSFDRLILLEKTQKLLDRMTFILVCEDTSTLLPANLIKQTYDRAINSFSPSDERVWSEFRGLFKAIDAGNARVKPPINAYNGGLFKEDEILDSLIIKDSIWDEIITLTKYDFESDLNVNILGHIFEQSISDLEELKAQVNEKEFDQKKSLRKKQGIFYTPEYITKFIVENTVGKYLEEHPDKLSDIKILDPACGSGAFLNQAHSYLLNEYKVRNEQHLLEKQQKGEKLTLWDQNLVENDKTILLNNLFGVDLSPESVEITKLSLWLKTAKASERLQNLDNNIRCGNSLVDDHAVAGERAFNWDNEFKKIMNEGGFDVIIGNPPYVTLTLGKNQEKIDPALLTYYKQHYSKSLEYKGNTYALFIEKSLQLIKTGGYISFIVPDTILRSSSFAKVRSLILKQTQIVSLVDIKYKVFNDAETGSTLVFVLRKLGAGQSSSKSVDTVEVKLDVGSLSGLEYQQVSQNIYAGDQTNRFFTDIEGINLIEKISKNKIPLGKVTTFYQGIITGDNGKFLSNVRESNLHEKIVRGRDISRYQLNYNSTYVLFDPKQLWSNTDTKFFRAKEKIISRQTGDSLVATYDSEQYLSLDSTHVQVLSDERFILKYVLALFNSKLLNFVYHKLTEERGRTFAQVKTVTLKQLPIVLASKETQKFISDKVDSIIALNKVFYNELTSASELLKNNYLIPHSSNRLLEFYKIGFNELLIEIEKLHVKLSLDQKEELQKWFKSKQKQLKEIESNINILDDAIDKAVYKLYGLNDVEIKTVESDISSRG